MNNSGPVTTNIEKIKLSYLKKKFNVALHIKEFITQKFDTSKPLALQALVYYTDQWGTNKCRVINYLTPYTTNLKEYYSLLDSDATLVLILRLYLLRNKHSFFRGDTTQDSIVRRLLRILTQYITTNKTMKLNEVIMPEPFNYCPEPLELLAIYIYSAAKKKPFRNHWDDKKGIVYQEWMFFLNSSLYEITSFLYPRYWIVNTSTHCKHVGKKGRDKIQMPRTMP